MNVLETDNWCLLLPPEWLAEHEDDVVRIVDTDEVGELEITTLHKESGNVEGSELLAMAREESPEVMDWSSTTAGAFSGVHGCFDEDDAHICEWYISAGPILLYITYICDAENAAMDHAAITDILGTLVLGDQASSAS